MSKVTSNSLTDSKTKDEIMRLRKALEKIEITAQAGLCTFSFVGAREFLKDVREEVAEALDREKPSRD